MHNKPMGTDGRLKSPILFAAVAGLAILFLKKQTASALVTYPISAFVQPGLVADLAATFPQTEEEDFVYAVWDYVGSSIPYEAIGSELYVVGDFFTCSDCYLGTDALQRKKGNCVSKSSLLASLLTNRVPSNRVAVVVGEIVNTAGGRSGHCWVEYQSPAGIWYVLESTIPPQGWMPVAMVSDQYIPNMIIINGSYQCNDHDMCQTVTKLTIGCNCQPTIKRIASRFRARPIDNNRCGALQLM